MLSIVILLLVVVLTNALILTKNTASITNTIRSSTSSTSLYSSKVKRNANFGKLQAGYLFPEIARRRNAYLAQNPNAKIISLGIGDTTVPIPEHILNGLKTGASKLGTKEGYTGYGAEQGVKELRDLLWMHYKTFQTCFLQP